MLGVVKKPKSRLGGSNMQLEGEGRGPGESNSGMELENEMMVDEKNESIYWVRKGEALWLKSNGNHAEAMKALEYFDKAIELNPLNYVAWMNKGLIFKKLHMQEEAIMCYDRAIKIKPSYPNSWINKGVLLGCVGKIREAIECFDKVLEIAPNNEHAQRDREMLLEVLKQRQCSKIIIRAAKEAS